VHQHHRRPGAGVDVADAHAARVEEALLGQRRCDEEE
jgi:hypothetical protein